MSLESYLDSKPLFYTEIDIQRAPKNFEKIKDILNLKAKVIHIIGTNGKGTTGRFLAHYLHKKGFSVGHYSSPHILNFNERIWLNGSNISDEALELAHNKLKDLVDTDLSYFEYTTFLSLFCFEMCDFIVFEAGLGGEFDATSVLKSDITLVTTIGFDHQDFLGYTIESIAKTKLKATKEIAIIGHQIFDEVFDIARELNIKYIDYRDLSDEVLLEYPEFLKKNLRLALATLSYLNIEIDLKLFENIELFGRFQKIAPNITIDVGHNSLSALEIKRVLDKKCVNLIYNTFKDKNYREILEILAPNIKKVYILNFTNPRLESLEKLTNILDNIGLKYDIFDKIDNTQEYLVYGSFSVVEEFLRGYGYAR